MSSTTSSVERGASADKNYFINGESVDRSKMSDDLQDPAAEAFDMGHIQEALRLAAGKCIRIFVAGAVTHCGKTTVCLSILAALRKAGIKASELAYIKPATQCEAPDLLSKWCVEEGVEYVCGENSPLVFYSGFTRSFLLGEQGTSEQWLDKIRTRIDQMAVGRQAIIVDGVGFPAVGSIVGVDNADVAKAARAPVLCVCKSGVGGAIDSFSLNCTYFASKGVPVLGAVFNFGAADGFYSWDKCAESIDLWFQRGGRRERSFGVVPKAPELDGLRERITETSQAQLGEFAKLNALHFAKYMDLPGLLSSAAMDPWNRQAPSKVGKAAEAQVEDFKPASRDSVTKAALDSGAKGGG